MNLIAISLDKTMITPQSASLERMREYSQLVNKIFVIVWNRDQAQPIEHDGKLFVYPTNAKCKMGYYFATFKIAARIIQTNAIDLVFTQDPFETGLAGWWLKRKFRIPLQLQVHTDFLSPYFARESLSNYFRVFIAKLLIRKADCFRVVSERIKRSLIKIGINEQKITVVPIYSGNGKQEIGSGKWESGNGKWEMGNGKQEMGNGKMDGTGNSKFTFLTIGRFVPVKNIEMQIKAMAEVVKKFPNIKLQIIGDGPEKSNYELIIKNYELKESVILIGWQEDLAEYYRKTDSFLMTSNYEGWGLVIIEAASHGLPIIMTDVGCAGEIIRNNESGLIIPVGDKQALIDSMIRLANDEKLRTRLAAGAQAALARLPSKEETMRLYRESWDRGMERKKLKVESWE